MREEIHLPVHFVHGLWFGMEVFRVNKPLKNSRNTSRPPLERHSPVNDYCESLHSRCDKSFWVGVLAFQGGWRTPCRRQRGLTAEFAFANFHCFREAHSAGTERSVVNPTPQKGSHDQSKGDSAPYIILWGCVKHHPRDRGSLGLLFKDNESDLLGGVLAKIVDECIFYNVQSQSCGCQGWIARQHRP